MAIDPDVETVLMRMQRDIDSLTDRPARRQAIKYTIEYDDGSVDVFDLVPA